MWARAILGATVFACACGRLDFASMAGTDDAQRDAAGDAGGELCVDVPPTDTCADFSGFHRIQAVPSTCPEGTDCQILENVATASQPINEGAGHLLVVFAYGGQNPGGSEGGTAPNLTFTVSDTVGNTYLPGPFVNDPRYDDSAIQIFYATNIAGGQNTVSVAESAPQPENFWTALVRRDDGCRRYQLDRGRARVDGQRKCRPDHHARELRSRGRRDGERPRDQRARHAGSRLCRADPRRVGSRGIPR